MLSRSLRERVSKHWAIREQRIGIRNERIRPKLREKESLITGRWKRKIWLSLDSERADWITVASHSRKQPCVCPRHGIGAASRGNGATRAFRFLARAHSSVTSSTRGKAPVSLSFQNTGRINSTLASTRKIPTAINASSDFHRVSHGSKVWQQCHDIRTSPAAGR